MTILLIAPKSMNRHTNQQPFRRCQPTSRGEARDLSEQMVYNCCVVPLKKSVCLGMAMFVLSVPILACALPGQQMSEEEQACCLHMADECSGSQMAESHSCCKKLPQIGASVFQVSSKYAPVALDYAIQVELYLQPNVAIFVAAVLPRMTVLPESSPGQPSVLRI